MKTIILALTLLVAGTTATFAQCGQKFTITTSKTEHLDSKGNLTHADDEKAVVTIGKTDLTIDVNDGEHKMTGVIKSDTCNWPVAYKEGKKIIKAVLTGPDGDDKNVTITITGKDGKVSLLFEMDGNPDDVIRVAADKFEAVM